MAAFRKHSAVWHVRGQEPALMAETADPRRQSKIDGIREGLLATTLKKGGG